MNQNASELMAGICRWSARILGSLLLLVVLVIAVGEGVPNPLAQPLPVQLGFLGLALLVGGILVGWRWELPGGIISFTGWCVFVLAVMHPKTRINVFVWLLAAPSLLYLAASLLSRDRRQPAHPSSS